MVPLFFLRGKTGTKDLDEMETNKSQFSELTDANIFLLAVKT